MYSVEKENIKCFVKNYFKNLSIKLFLIWLFFFVIENYLMNRKEVIGIIIGIIISFFMVFRWTGLLRKETEKEIQKFYNKTSKHDDGLVIICNLKKFNGPTFGTLHINKQIIEFNPFKDNLKKERFLIKKTDMKNIKISLLKVKISILNRIFYKELNKAISISCDSINVLLQTPEPEKTIEKIRALYNNI